jgi:hypothetical protein
MFGGGYDRAGIRYVPAGCGSVGRGEAGLWGFFRPGRAQRGPRDAEELLLTRRTRRTRRNAGHWRSTTEADLRESAKADFVWF